MAVPFNEEVDPQILIGALLIGAGVGFLSGAFGKGGSAVSTPLLHALGVPAIVAIASPLPATIPSTLLASRGYARAGHVDREVLRTGLIIGLPLTALGAFLTRWIAGEPLVLATDAILLVLSMRVLLGAHTSAHADETESQPDDAHPVSRTRTVGVVAVAAMVSGLLGNSGGFLLAPLFMNVLHMPVRRARHVARARGRPRGAGHDRARVARAHRLVAVARVRARIGAVRDPRRDDGVARP